MKRHALGIEIAVVAIVVAVIIALANRNVPATETAPLADPPPMTERMALILAESSGFQHLVSYTDNGFEPPRLSVKKGQTVRFTNNASHGLWVASTSGVNMYPRGTAESCGQSALDSCGALQPLEFWEFTFEKVGEWSFANYGNAAHTGVVVVTQ